MNTVSILIGFLAALAAVQFTPVAEWLNVRNGAVLRCDAGRPALVYFSARGRAETTQLLLELGDCPYDRISVTDWPTLKAVAQEAGLSFGQLPGLLVPTDALSAALADRPVLTAPPALAALLPNATVPFYMLTQSSALNLFVADSLNLVGGSLGNSSHNLHVAELLGATGDLATKYSKLVYGKETVTPADAETLLTEAAPWFSFFEQRLGATSYYGGHFLLGRQPTLVDASLFATMDSIARLPGAWTHLQSTYPLLTSTITSFANLPRIQAYLRSDRRLPTANGATASYDTPTVPGERLPYD
mmetsp:Transcript_1707/g.5506  ORF Transcript_1707/g.5506 Transcript_1707/m.5506 type:complete len:302 (-) Transcript_1707:70-975(-)